MEVENIKTCAMLDLTHSIAGNFIARYEYPWQTLPDIKNCIYELIKTLPKDEYTELTPDVWVNNTAKLAPSAVIMPPCIICAGAEIRHCAYIRGSAIIGCNSVVGNSTEVKNAIVFDNVEIPHFNYVGDSILGYKSHLGAGAVTSNIKSDRRNIVVSGCGFRFETGFRKMGAILGDYVEVGCNSTLNPGTVICPHTSVYPNSCVRGIIPADSIYKSKENITFRKKENN